MIDALFRFRGRLGRLAFLGWNLAGMALVGAIALAFLFLGAGLSGALTQASGAATVLGVLMAATAGGVGIWMTIALAAKRVRDIGLAPLPVMIGAAILLAFDQFILTRLTDVRFFSPLASYTPLGGLFSTGWMVFLICWPGRDSEAGYARDKAMRDIAIAITLITALASCVLLAPFNYLVAGRHALAQRALAAGWPSVSAAVLSALAEVPDSRALNNLGVLRARGVGTEQNSVEARRLFARASADGSARARLNAVMVTNGACSQNVSRASEVAAALAPIGPLDPVAASLIQDCLYFEATNRALPDRDQRSVAAGAQIQQVKDANTLLHSGSALLNRARTMQQPRSGDDDGDRRHDATVLPLARKAMELLFAAADAGEPGAYEPLGILAMQFGEKLGSDPLAVRLRERSNWEWLEVGAQKGDWAAQCRVADARITELRFGSKPYTRQAFDDTVAKARQCIDRQEVKQEPRWYREPEWLAVTPRVPHQARPVLELSTTEAALNGFLFFDADRKLKSSAVNGAPVRKP